MKNFLKKIEYMNIIVELYSKGIKDKKMIL